MMTTTTTRAPRTRWLVRRGALAGVLAATGTTLLAAVARAAGVTFTVNGESIPLPAFTLWTLVGAALGVVLAQLLGDRRRFTVVCVIGTALSLIPPIQLPDDVATTAALVAAHLLAAAIVVPLLRQALGTTSPTRKPEKE